MNLSGNNIKRYILRRYSIDELESILNQKLNNQSRNLKHYADKSLDKFMNIVVYSITDEILEQLTDGWVEDSPIPEKGLYEFIQKIFGERIIKKYDELRSMNLQENISIQLKRRTNLLDRVIDNLLPNMYPCDYNSSDHFVVGVLDEIIWFLPDEKELQGIERMDIEDYILEYKYDELTEYFNERCDVLEKGNLQETIKRILREETRFEKMGEDNYKSCSMSDITRMEIIDDFFDRVSDDPNYNIDEPNYDMLLDDWDGYDDQVYIQNKLDNNTIIFYEGWVDSCWSAVYNKPQYKGMTKKQVIKDIITNRFPRIGEEFNMTIKDYGYINDDGYIMYVVLEKY